MLLNNCFRLYHGNLAEGSAHALLPGQWNSYRQFEKFAYRSESTVLQTAADPPGHYLPGVYQPPIIVGEMALRTIGEGALDADLLPSRNMTIDLTGAGDLTAAGALVVSMLLAMTGSGSLTAAITGRLNMTADLTGTGDLAADMTGLGNMLIDMLGEGDLEATIAAFGDMTIDLTVTGTGLSTANVGAAVWQALAASFNGAGTMGEKLNDAGSAANPWTEDLSGPQTAGTAGALLAAIVNGLTAGQQAQLLDVWQRLGLDLANPLVTTATSIEAGGVSQTIDEAAGPIITVTRT